MRLDFVQQVLVRELISAFRDTRAFITAIVIPFIMTPVFMLGFPLLIGNSAQSEVERKQTIAVIGENFLPSDLKSALEKIVVLEPFKGSDLEMAVQQNQFDAAMRLTKPLPSEAGNEIGAIEIISKRSNQKAQVVKSKLEGVIEAYSKSLVLKKLTTLGLSANTLTPVETKAVNAESVAEQASGFMAFYIPYMIFFGILTFATSIAVDATAGEKERGTLEILLVSPVRREEVVFGKILATTVLAMLGAVASVSAFLFTGVLSQLLPKNPSAAGFGGTLSLDVQGYLQLLLLAMSIALALAAMLISIAIYAKTVRQANTYLTPIQIVAALMSILLATGDFLSRTATLYATPLIGSILTIFDLTKGIGTWNNIAIAIASNLVLTIVLFVIANRNFRSEQVLFRN